MSIVPRQQWPIYQIEDGKPCRLTGFHYSETPLPATLEPRPMFISDHPTEYGSPWLRGKQDECYSGWFELSQPKVVVSESPYWHLDQITEWSEQGYDSVVWRDSDITGAAIPPEIFLFNAQAAQITQMIPVPIIARILTEQSVPLMFTPPEDPEHEYLTQII